MLDEHAYHLKQLGIVLLLSNQFQLDVTIAIVSKIMKIPFVLLLIKYHEPSLDLNPQFSLLLRNSSCLKLIRISRVNVVTMNSLVCARSNATKESNNRSIEGIVDCSIDASIIIILNNT